MASRHKHVGSSRDRQRKPAAEPSARKSTARQLPAEFETADDAELLDQVADHYHRGLSGSPGALRWLEQGGIGDPELVEHFRLGLANRTLGLRLPKKNRKAGAELRARLQRLGVLRSSGHEQLSGCVTVPLLDDAGQVVQVYGRKVGRRQRPGTSLEVWLSDERRGLVNRAAFESHEVLVASCILDALVLWAAGHRNATAIHGLDGPVEDLQAAVEKHGTKRVVLVWPRSEEGESAAARLGAALAETGAQVLCAWIPKGVSCRRLAHTEMDAAAAFGRLVREAEPLVGGRAVAASTDSPPDSPRPAVSDEVDKAEDTGKTDDAVEVREGDELVLQLGDRRWRARGLSTNKARGVLRVNLLVSREDVGFHVDVFDLCSARHRAAFIRMATEELCVDEHVIKKDLGRVLLALEDAQDELLRRALEPAAKIVEMTDAERAAALELLRDPNLLDRVLADLERLGVVGEETNLLLAYLVAVSRKLAEPLAVVVQSSSAAGKSSVMRAVLSLVPDEDRIVYSAMTGQSLYYMGSTDLRHKVLCVAEEHGVEKASYALKLLQSEGALTIASTGKDPGSGRLVSQQYRVEGPVAIMLTATSVDIDEELLSRCLLLAVDESPEQTRRIHERQRRAQTLAGLREQQQRDRVLELHQNAQRLLRPVRVVNPHLGDLAYGDLRVRARRDHRKLLGLLEVIALLHQHQRLVRAVEDSGKAIDVVEITPGDIEIAKRLTAHVGVGIDDLPPQTRRVLELLDEYADEQATKLGIHRDHVRFGRRQVRLRFGLGDTQLKVHLRRLVDAELVLAHRAPHGRGAVYSMAFDSRATASPTSDAERSGIGRAPVGPRSGGGRPPVGPQSSGKSRAVAGACTPSARSRPEKCTSVGARTDVGRDVRESEGAD